jgi:hypothetical protein
VRIAAVRLAWFVAVSALLLPGLGRAEERTVAVLVVGRDPAAAGLVQRALERGLHRDHVVLDRSAVIERLRLARGLGPSREASPDPAIEAAREAFYAGRLDTALERLAAAEGQLAGAAAPAPARQARLRILLWRAAVLHALRRPAEGRAAVRSALLVDPALKVDLAEFWPSLAETVDEVRAELSTVRVAIVDAPENAHVTLDDVPVGVSFLAPAGRYRVTVSAPGYRSVVREEALARDTQLSVPLPFDLEPARLGSGPALKAALAVDHVVLVAVEGEGVRVSVDGQAHSPRLLLTEPARILTWTLAALSDHHIQRESPVELGLSALAVVHSRALETPSGESASSSGLGLGLEVQASLRRGWRQAWAWTAAARVRGSQLGRGEITSTVDADEPDGPRQRLGWTMGAELHGGFRWGLFARHLELSLELGARYRHYDAHDIRGTSGPWKAFETLSYVGVDLRLGALFRVGPASAGVTSAFLPLSVPLAGEEPTGSTLLEAHVGWRLSTDWTIAVRLALDALSAKSGDPAAIPDLASDEAARSERDVSLGLAVEHDL